MRLLRIVLLIAVAVFTSACSDPVAPATPPAPALPEDSAPPAPEPVDEAATSFSVVIASVPTRKIDAIKAVRQVTRLGLEDSKDLVDRAPSVIGKGLSKAAAEEMAAVLEAAGVDVEIRPE